jgi:hypothetical protein
MKNFFTLIAGILMSMAVNAETLIDFAQSQEIGIKVSGTTTIDAVKLKTNTVSTPGIKFANGYTKDGVFNGNCAKIFVDGGFKAGDVITIAGAFNNADETKTSAIDIFTLEGTTATVLFTTKQFINGRLVDDDPVAETYTVEAAADTLYLGRNGNTGTFITTLKVVRGEESTIGGGGGETTPSGAIDYPTSQDGITVSGTTEFSTVKIKTNTTSVPGIKFANSYTKDGALNDNYALLSVDGGFKTGDVITIAGAFNNADETKTSAIDIFTVDGTTPNVLFTTQQFINGRLVNDDPVAETFTLEADAEKLYLGRNGNTGTIVTTLKVNRGGSAGISQIVDVKVNAPAYNLAGQKVSNDYKGVVILNGKKIVRK